MNKSLNEVKRNSKRISEEDYETLVCSIDVINVEVKSTNPRKSFIRNAISGLNGLKNRLICGSNYGIDSIYITFHIIV